VEEEGKVEGKGRDGKWRGGKGRAPKLLLNQSPSEPCYATVDRLSLGAEAYKTEWPSCILLVTESSVYDTANNLESGQLSRFALSM